MTRSQTGNKNRQNRGTKSNPELEMDMTKNPLYPAIYLQLDSREISQEQLAAEVKSIYSRLSTVEAECISIDNAHEAVFKKGENSLADDLWRELIDLHRTLLYIHYDFLLASQ